MEMGTATDIFGKRKLLLASGSPRRRELLDSLGIKVEHAQLHDVDESYPADMSPMKVPEYLSRLKSQAYRSELADDEVLVTADTVVVLDGKVLGKPVDEAEAKAMLRSLSGRVHQVVTGVTLATSSRSVTFSEVTDVEFDTLSDSEIDYYVANFKPFDKAGAYGIQEWIGYVGVKGIRGDYYNVMGLPVNSLCRHLKSI
jgi:septum formation protein maf